jgi:hypothetical protein
MACSIKALFLASESSFVPPISALGSAAPLRFVVSAVAMPADAFHAPHLGPQSDSKLSPDNAWTALAMQHDQVLLRRADSLAYLLNQLRADCLENWPIAKSSTLLQGLQSYLAFHTGQKKPHDRKHPSKLISTALMLQANEILEKDLQCQAYWSPDDIAAECWLEAASHLQVPVAHLLIDFEVNFTAQGHWMASYLACPENLLHAYQKQLTALNCQLDVLTVPSQSQELCELWGLKPEIMAQLLRPPHPGELASRYFKLFKESDLC